MDKVPTNLPLIKVTLDEAISGRRRQLRLLEKMRRQLDTVDPKDLPAILNRVLETLK